MQTRTMSKKKRKRTRPLMARQTSVLLREWSEHESWAAVSRPNRPHHRRYATPTCDCANGRYRTNTIFVGAEVDPTQLNPMPVHPLEWATASQQEREDGAMESMDRKSPMTDR